MGPDEVVAGSTDVSVVIRIMDSTDGTPETAVTFETSGIDLWYRREGAAAVDITEATLAALTTAHADGGFLAIADGLYRLDVPDAAFAVGAPGVQIGGTVTGMVVYGPYIKIRPKTVLDGTFSGTHTSTTSDLGANAPANDITGMTLFAPTDNLSVIVTSYNTSTGVATHAAWDTGTGVTNGEPWVLIPTAPIDTVTLAAINAEADTALNDYDAPTKAELDVLGTASLATAAALATVDGVVDAILEDTGTDGVVVAAASKTGYSLSAAGVQAIWDALTSALTTVGSIGKAIVDLAGRIVGTLASGTHVAQTGDSFARLGATGSGLTSLAQASVATEARLAELDPANLPADVDAVLVDTGTTLPATLSTIAGFLDTEIAAILLDTGTDIPALIAALNNLSSAESQTAAEAAITAAFGIVTGTVNDASATTTGFTVATDVSTDVRLGVLRFTDGALARESRLVTHTGTTIAVVQPTSVPGGLATVAPYSAAPANGAAYTFRPL